MPSAEAVGFLDTARGLLLATTLSAAAMASQATVQYGAGTIASDADVLNTGVVVVANNLGSGATAITVNGVAFGNSMAGLGNMANGGGDFSTQFTVNSGLDQLLSGLAYQYSNSSSLTLTGLTAGTSYLLQLLMSNDLGGNDTGKDTRVSLQGNFFNLH